jgi:hypothetical protein
MHSKKLFDQLGKDEQYDFMSACKKYHRGREEFELRDISERIDPNNFVRREITVVKLSNGIHKKYESGHATAWLVEFENDLKQGYF